MNSWYFTKKQLRETPSYKDGVPFETEQRYRKEGVRFILQIGGKMNLGITTISTGSLYFHRFYMLRSFRQFPRFLVAACCLFLGGKTEETPKLCRDIVRVSQMLLVPEHFAHFGQHPCSELLVLESILLKTLKFDLLVDHPHKFIVKYAKEFLGDQSRIHKIVQMAWNFVNDSLTTMLCLEWEPEIIAISVIHLSSKLSKFPILNWKNQTENQMHWWDLHVQGLPIKDIEDICHQVLDIYQKFDPKHLMVKQEQPQMPLQPVKQPAAAAKPKGKIRVIDEARLKGQSEHEGPKFLYEMFPESMWQAQKKKHHSKSQTMTTSVVGFNNPAFNAMNYAYQPTAGQTWFTMAGSHKPNQGQGLEESGEPKKLFPPPPPLPKESEVIPPPPPKDDPWTMSGDENLPPLKDDEELKVSGK